jgi:hypothetical protein
MFLKTRTLTCSELPAKNEEQRRLYLALISHVSPQAVVLTSNNSANSFLLKGYSKLLPCYKTPPMNPGGELRTGEALFRQADQFHDFLCDCVIVSIFKSPVIALKNPVA